MSMRLYKVNGQYYTWDYLHNELGYTESASTTTTYKSSDSDTWGQSIVDSGYRIATDSSDLETYEFWIDNTSGWFSASEMAQEGYYPSFATDGPRFVKEGELSVSVEISGNSWSDTWYLLKKDVSIGWCTERELEENGWEPDRGEIVGGLISDTYDKRIYSFGNGGLLVPGGYAYSDGDLLDMQWDFGGVIEEYVPISQPAIGGVMTATTDSKFYGDIGGVLELDALPTVSSISGSVGTLSQQGTQASVADGSSVYHWRYVDGAYQLSTIGAGNTIGIVRINNNRGEDTQRGVGWVAERTSDGYVKITNNSGTTYTNLYGAWFAYCDSTSVTVVTVYNLSNPIAYNAFKCVLNGTDYYYVMDNTTGSTMNWTDDLSSIGYTLTPFTFEEYELYPDSSLTSIRYMSNITSSSEISSATTTFRKQLFLDSSKAHPFVYDTSKIYVKGSYPSGWWTPDPIQSTADMPSSTTGTISSATFALILVGALDSTIGVNGYGWVLAITNYNGNNSTSGDSRYYVRVFSPGPLPTVSIINNFGSYNWLQTQSGTAVTVNAGDSVPLYIRSIGRAAYDSNKSYAVLQWQVTQQVTAGRTEFSIINDSGNVSAMNVSGSALSFLQARVAVCSSNQAEIVTVYNTSNEAFNAFKYTLDGTDYYYVLDGTQTDWTDDLGSIGYVLALELDVGLRWSWSGDPSTGTWRSIDLSTDDWYYAGLLSQADADRLTAFGIDVKNVDNRSGVVGNVGFNPYYSYKVIAIYSDIVNGQGTGEITFDPSKFYAYNCNYYPNYGYWDALLLEYSGASGTAKGWRVRIEKINPTPTRHTAYTQTDKSARSVAANSVGVDVYDENGLHIPLDSSLIYSVIAYYESSSGDPVQPNGQILLQTFFSSYISISNNITQRTIQRIEYIATPKQPQ